MKTITLTKDDFSAVNTPQVKVILSTLQENAGVGEEFPWSELVKLVDANAQFVSRQGASRVMRFYEKPLIENGLITVAGSDKPVKEEKSFGHKDPDAPAKTGGKKAKKTKSADDKEGPHGGAHDAAA